jgi:hypothetical protein
MAWDITNMVYEGVSLDLSTIQPSGMYMKTDGLDVWVIDAADDKVKHFDIDVAWNISTAVSSANEFALGTSVFGLDFNADGTKLYYCEGQAIKERTMGTPYTVSTAGAATTLDVSADLASVDLKDIRWGDSGDKLFFTDDNDLTVYQYDCGTAYDISTAVFNAVKDLDLSSRFPFGDGLVGLFFQDDGSKVFVGVGYDVGAATWNVQTPAVREFSLSTAWDLGTATEIASADPNIGNLISFMPHFYSGSYDWGMARSHDTTAGTVLFGDSANSAPWFGGVSSGEGGMRWDDDDNEIFWNNRYDDTTWEVRFRFFRRPDNASLGGDNRLMIGACNSPFHSESSPLARPWSLVWNDVTDEFGLMAAGSGIQVSAGPAGGDWTYAQFLDAVIQRENTDTFHFWLNGTYYGSRTTGQAENYQRHGFAYGKISGIAGWDYASGLQTVAFRSYSNLVHTSGADLPSATLDFDQTALNIIGRSIVDETGRESVKTYIAFGNSGEFVYAMGQDTLQGNKIYQYNLGVVIPSCSGDGFEEYVSGGTVRLQVTTLSGAHHLEGQTVKAVVDGALHDVPIVDGQPTLPAGVKGAHIQLGWPFTADIETLDIEEGDGAMQGKEKAVRNLLLKFYKSVMPLIGPDENRLVQMKHPEKFDFDEPLPIFSGKVEQRIERDWNKSGKVLIRMKDPFPMTVISAAPDIPEIEDD